MDQSSAAADYYDAKADTNIEGFVRGNARIERAWQTIARWAPQTPHTILDLGCGIGEICWRAGRKWPNAEITGVDLSPRSISMAERLFGSPKISFSVIQHLDIHLPPQDLVLLVDVFEHIPSADVPELEEVIGRLSTDSTRLIVTFPTAEYQAWLRQHQPQGMQPVDRDIRPMDIQALADRLGLEVLFYERVDVWRIGDYAHAVLGHPDFAADTKPPSPWTGKASLQSRSSLSSLTSALRTPLAAAYRRLRRIRRAKFVRRKLPSIGG